MRTPKRVSSTRWIVVGVVLLLLVLFRAPLVQWFSIGSPGGAVPAHPQHMSTQPSHSFGPAQLAALREAFTATEELRLALSLDQVEPLGPAAGRVRAGLDALGDVAAPEEVDAMLRRVAISAQAIGEATSAPAARVPYAELSEALFQLAQIDPRLQEGWQVFFCPMAEGFPKWFQGSEQIENPYMGQAMLACGSASDWVEEDVAAAPLPSGDEVAHYTCPMHPSVRQPNEGTCPICNMDLTPVTHEDLRTGDVFVDSIRRQRIGVRTQTATKRQLTRSIRAVGQVAWDEGRVQDVTARVDGWVEDLRVTRTGDPVAKGATLLRFYSPDLLATQRELLAAPPGGRLATSARERLRLWGMSSWAIDDMLASGEPHQRVSIPSPMAGVVIDKQVNAGAHVAAGALLFRIADPDHVWVEADIFEQDMPHVTPGQTVQVALPHAPTQERAGVVAYVYPALDAGARTGRVRIELDNADGALRPGMLAHLNFEVALGEQLAVPSDAVIHTGPRRLVFVDKGEGRLRPVEVHIGPRAGDWIIVEDGIVEGDVVVTSGAFLLAAESRIRSATDHWEAHDEAQ